MLVPDKDLVSRIHPLTPRQVDLPDLTKNRRRRLATPRVLELLTFGRAIRKAELIGPAKPTGKSIIGTGSPAITRSTRSTI